MPQTTAQQRKIHKVMHEFKEGDLTSSTGRKVKNPKQAIAIALSESGASQPPEKRASSGKKTKSSPTIATGNKKTRRASS